MAGLVPAIHALLSSLGKKGVDARHKAGHDVGRSSLDADTPVIAA
ncbi:MAG TPA: hypothetical protein VHD59_15005 [Pseudolabrys sp.]|jgi:hypothetical protein|nr:hypothetical protein [Pseudolabrys sp.]